MTVLVMGDAFDSAIGTDLQPDCAFDLPFSVASIEKNRRGLTVDFADRQTPRSRLRE